jgi:hypothetical protein
MGNASSVDRAIGDLHQLSCGYGDISRTLRADPERFAEFALSRAIDYYRARHPHRPRNRTTWRAFVQDRT